MPMERAKGLSVARLLSLKHMVYGELAFKLHVRRFSRRVEWMKAFLVPPDARRL